jgi:hypothetical protein
VVSRAAFLAALVYKIMILEISVDNKKRHTKYAAISPRTIWSLKATHVRDSLLRRVAMRTAAIDTAVALPMVTDATAIIIATDTGMVAIGLGA